MTAEQSAYPGEMLIISGMADRGDGRTLSCWGMYWFLVLTEAFRGPDIAEVTHKLYHSIPAPCWQNVRSSVYLAMNSKSSLYLSGHQHLSQLASMSIDLSDAEDGPCRPCQRDQSHGSPNKDMHLSGAGCSVFFPEGLP